jgi:hypothetical protein
MDDGASGFLRAHVGDLQAQRSAIGTQGERQMLRRPARSFSKGLLSKMASSPLHLPQFPLGVKATLSAPLWSWRAIAFKAPNQSGRSKRWVSIGVMSIRPSATSPR